MSRSVHVREVSREVVQSEAFQGYFISVYSAFEVVQSRYFVVTSDSVELDRLEGSDWYVVIGDLANRLGDYRLCTDFRVERQLPSGKCDPFSWRYAHTLCFCSFGANGLLDETEEPASFEGFDSFYRGLCNDFMYSIGAF